MLDVSMWSLRASPPTTVEGLSVGLFSWQPLKRAVGFLVLGLDGRERFLGQSAAIPLAFYLALLVWIRRPGRLPRAAVLSVLLSLGIVAVGPVLLVGDLAFPNPPYIAAVKALSPLQRLWWPSRALLVAAVPLGTRASPGDRLAAYEVGSGVPARGLRRCSSAPGPSSLATSAPCSRSRVGARRFPRAIAVSPARRATWRPARAPLRLDPGPPLLPDRAWAPDPRGHARGQRVVHAGRVRGVPPVPADGAAARRRRPRQLRVDDGGRRGDRRAGVRLRRGAKGRVPSRE